MKPKSKELKPIAPKIRVESADWYGQYFQTLNAGATFVLDAFPGMYRATLAEMRGKFSEGELGMILDVMNGHGILLTAMGQESLIGQHIHLSLYDSFRLYPGTYESTWGINDPEDFISRIDSLPRFSKICLEVWAAGFWEKYQETDINEWRKPLLS